MSIATTKGDAGETGLIGGRRVSKGGARVDALGAIDELMTHLAFARSICPRDDTRGLIRGFQRQLFAIGESLASDPDGPVPACLDAAIVEALTVDVHRLEAIDGLLIDWALSGDNAPAAALDVARAVCRRAERSVVRLQDGGERVDPVALAYLNRLADLLWLLGRQLECDANVDARLRDDCSAAPRWSRAW